MWIEIIDSAGFATTIWMSLARKCGLKYHDGDKVACVARMSLARKCGLKFLPSLLLCIPSRCCLRVSHFLKYKFVSVCGL